MYVQQQWQGGDIVGIRAVGYQSPVWHQAVSELRREIALNQCVEWKNMMLCPCTRVSHVCCGTMLSGGCADKWGVRLLMPCYASCVSASNPSQSRVDA